jgi:hypothetical protein
MAADMHELWYEVRVPKGVKVDGLTAVDVVTDQGMSGTRVRLMKHREEEGFNVYATSSLMEPGERRHAIVIQPDSGPKPEQVFVLSIPKTPKPADWSKWQPPSYIESENAAWSFMHGLKGQNRSTNIPADSFEVRYRIAEWKR